VGLFYDTMWHSTEMMTMAIADGIAQEGVDCDVCRLNVTSRAEIARLVLESRGFLIGSPTLNSNVFPTVGGLLSYVKGLRPKKRLVGAYGSCGWAGGAVKIIDAELRGMGLDVLDPFEVKYRPTAAELEKCTELGREVARRVRAMGAE
jgi:flavorubredoxin